MLKLYQVTFDGCFNYVEATSFGEAVALWSAQMRKENGDEWDDEEPEIVLLMECDGPVIRRDSPNEL